jgi:hypothetical protein
VLLFWELASQSTAAFGVYSVQHREKIGVWIPGILNYVSARPINNFLGKFILSYMPDILLSFLEKNIYVLV